MLVTKVEEKEARKLLPARRNSQTISRRITLALVTSQEVCSVGDRHLRGSGWCLYLSHSEEATLLFVCCRWLLPDQCVRQPMSDPEPGQGEVHVGLPDAGGPGSVEGVELQAEPRGPETEGEHAEPGRQAACCDRSSTTTETLVVLQCVWVCTVIHSVAVTHGSSVWKRWLTCRQ